MIHSVLWRLSPLMIASARMAPSLWSHFAHYLMEHLSERSHLIQDKPHTHSYQPMRHHERDYDVPINVVVKTNGALLNAANGFRYISDMRVEPRNESTNFPSNIYDRFSEPIIIFSYPDLPPLGLYSQL